MVVWIASYPRSGNTYFRILLYYVCGVKTFSLYNDPLFEEIGASETVGHELLPATIEELSRDKEVFFVKTHGLPTDGAPAIYLVRDGRDALVSYARYILVFEEQRDKLSLLKRVVEKRRFRRTVRKLIVGSESFGGGWSNHVLSWTRQRREGVTFAVRYEDLVVDPVAWLQKSLEVLQVRLEVGIWRERPSFDELHHKWPHFFRKGRIGSWCAEMPRDLERLFWEHHGEAMDAFGYGRDPTARHWV